MLSLSTVSFEQSLQHPSPQSKELSLPSAIPTVLQLTDQRSLTQSAAQSAGAVSLHHYWAEHLQRGQELQVLEMPRGPEIVSSSRFEEPVVPGYQQKMMQSNPNLVCGNKGQPGLPESGLRNKMKSFLHWINPKTKGKGHKESVFSTAEKVASTRQNVEKSLAPAKSPTGQPKRQKTRGDPKAQSPPTEQHVGLAFLDNPPSSDGKLQHCSHSHQLYSASVLGHPHHCPQGNIGLLLKKPSENITKSLSMSFYNYQAKCVTL
uniref:Uncharacterized protein n=1 Tax=Equus asinus asinus TaxID=83772 RepID=A0A8C4MC38_EQUAS